MNRIVDFCKKTTKVSRTIKYSIVRELTKSTKTLKDVCLYYRANILCVNLIEEFAKLLKVGYVTAENNGGKFKEEC